MKKILVLLVLSMSAALTACGNDDDPSASGASFNDQDVTFTQQMIPHHKQAVEMAELAPTRAGSAEVKDLAAAIQQAQDPEIKTMTAWLKDWDKPLADDGMEGMDHGSDAGGMTGMMSEGDMKSLEAATGAEFDTMWLTMMVQHHQGAIDMADTEISKGSNTDAKALAKEIKDAQEDEIATMTALLDK